MPSRVGLLCVAVARSEEHNLLLQITNADKSADVVEPARFDLPVDFRGKWKYDSHTGCEEYMDATGTKHFKAGKTVCALLPEMKPEQHIWQDCLEMTITGTNARGKSFPLHHMILDDEYLTDDWTEAGEPESWTSKIVKPDPTLDVDADPEMGVVVFEISSGGQARRYIDTKRRFVQVWSVVGSDGATTSFKIKYNKDSDLGCNGYDPTFCKDRSYDDGEGEEGWTPACCRDADYGNHLHNDNKRDCDGRVPAQTLTTAAPAQSPCAVLTATLAGAKARGAMAMVADVAAKQCEENAALQGCPACTRVASLPPAPAQSACAMLTATLAGAKARGAMATAAVAAAQQCQNKPALQGCPVCTRVASLR